MNERLSALAKRMRREPSVTERLLWTKLRDRRMTGLKFRRQMPIGRYVADFVCLRHRIIVEADGPFHDADHDDKRDAWLTSQGFRVMRFKNEDIERDRDLVARTVLAAIEAPLIIEIPCPLPGEGGAEGDG